MADGPRRRDWRAGAATPVQGQASKSSSIFVAGLAAVALGGALIGLLYWLLGGSHGAVRYINIPLCEYDNPIWPPVPFAEADANRIAKHFANSEVAFKDQEKLRFAHKLDSLKTLGDSALVLHISGLAVTHDNRVYLLTSKAVPGTPDANWHPLDSVIKSMAECPAKNKLLILDVSQPVAAAARGVLADDATARIHSKLQALAAENKIPGLILVSAGPGEYSQPFDEQNASALAYFMDQALSGYADGYVDSSRDTWVKVREMAAMVKDRVGRWANFSRGVPQTVTLYGEGDFRLTSREKPSDWPEPDYKPVPVPKWITEGWTQRDQWNNEGARALAPHLVQQLERVLLRAESRKRAGIPDDKVLREFADVGGELAKSWAGFKLVQPPAKSNLVGLPAPAPVLDKMNGWLANYNGKKKLDDAIGKPEATPEVKTLAAWLRLADSPLDRVQVSALCNEVAPKGAAMELSETVFLSKLRELADQRRFVSKERPWPSEKLGEREGETICFAVRAEQAALEAFVAAAAVPEAHQWLKDRLDSADKKRHDAEKLLWSLGNEELVGGAKAAANVTVNCRELEKQYGDIRDDARRYFQAWQAMTDAMAELPGMAATLSQLNRDAVRESPVQWTTAAQAATRLADMFDDKSPPNAELLAQHAQAVTTSMNQLRTRLSALAKLEPDGMIAPGILATSRMSAKDRETWWAQWRKWTAAKDQWLAENEAQTKSGLLPSSVNWTGPEIEKAQRRANMAIELGALCGLATTELANEHTALGERAELAQWNALAPKLLPLTAAGSATNAAVANRMSRVIGTTDAAARESARVRKEFWTWAAERYEQEAGSRDLAPVQFYRKAVKNARDAADTARSAAGL